MKQQTILILIAALLLFGTAYAGDTGLGSSPFSTGGQFSATQANAMNNAINDNDTRIDALITLSGVASEAEELGTFPGTTIDDNATIYDALEDIETAYEAHAADPTAHVVPEAYDATGWDGDNGPAAKNDVRDKIESLSFGGDIASVWDVTSGAATRLYQAAIVIADGDATPDVSAGNVFITANTGATTITDFDTSLVNGQPIWIIVNDANTTFDMTSSGLEGVGNKDYTATNGDLVMGVYSTVDSQWHLLFWPSSIGTVSLQEGIVWADGDGTGSIAWAFATSAARTITIPGDANITLAYTVASGTSALGTAEIASGACADAVTTTATGALTTDVIDWGFNGDPTSTTGYQATANGMLTIIAYPSAGNVNFKVCNNTGAAITPGAVTLNWKVIR